MAFGSGSSFATDRWTRRKGSPSSLQALSVGSAKRLHQHSSSKPTAQVLGFSAATSISRSRLLFSFVQGVRGGYPPLGAHPANPQQARKRRPDRLSGDALFGEPVLESRFGGHPQGPQARLVSELPRGGWSIPRNFSALSSSKASRVRLGREDFASRARRPLRLKSWMASRTVWEAHPRFEAIFGARSPFALAKSTCERRMAKASLERSPFSRLSRSFSDNGRTKIGVFMDGIVTRQPKPILKMH